MLNNVMYPGQFLVCGAYVAEFATQYLVVPTEEFPRGSNHAAGVLAERVDNVIERSE